MISVEGRSVPPRHMRYEDAGDWTVDAHGTRHYRVVDMGNADYEFLVLLHEMIESHLCLRRGVTQEMVDAFDMGFEGDDAGSSRSAPYHDEHLFALRLERMMAYRMGIDWDDYEKRLEQCVC